MGLHHFAWLEHQLVSGSLLQSAVSRPDIKGLWASEVPEVVADPTYASLTHV